MEPEQVFFHRGPAELLGLRGGAAALPGWLSAAALTAVGRFGDALALLGQEPPRLLAGEPTVPPGDPAACAVAASACRQLELYPAALALDRAGLAAAGGDTGSGSGGAGGVREGRFDCRVGLVADHVGLGDVDGALRLLAPAAAADPGGWRPAVRLAWLRAEAGLLAGDPAAAAAAARQGVEAATRAGAPRHRAKSLLFLGVAEHACEAAGRPRPGGDGGPEPAALLLTAAVEADRLGALPLVWPAWWQHADAVGGGWDHPSRERARVALGDLLAGLPAPLTGWLAGRPAPRRVLGGPPGR